MEWIKKYWRWGIVIVGVLFNIFIWYSVYHELPSKYLTIAFLNIGQGDAIYIESPTRNRMIIDGGPGRAILSELRKVMPFYERDIDTLIVTNPDKDHFAGFINVLDLFTIKKVIESGTKSDTETYKVFKQKVTQEKSEELIAKRGMIIHLGGGADVDILFPDTDVSGFERNEGSIIAKLVYGSTSVMLTGDAPSKTEEHVLDLDASDVKSTVLKVGHHGSRTSASETFTTAVDPEYAVISAGKNNRYGHPHTETTELFSKLHIPVYGTYDKGTIVMKTDGSQFTTEFK